MTDVAPADTAPTDAPTDTPADAPDTDTTDWKAEAEKHKALARKHEDRAKANAAAAKELESLRASTMTDQEKAVAEAVAQARQETLAAVGSHLAAAEVRIAAAGRLDDAQLSTLLDNVDLAKFLAEDGTVDGARVAAFVDGIAPKPTDNAGGFPPVDLGQGARSGPALNSDPLLDAIKSAVGTR
jgi:hypothetical protein